MNQPVPQKKKVAPKYTIFAGVNGVGKTSLYSILCKSENFGERINIDEMVAMHGDWRDKMLQLTEGRNALKKISQLINYGVTFHEETTIPGATVLRLIKKAKAKGYKIQLYYVGVENLDTAIKRVRNRVEKGGHGVDEKLIKQRFEKKSEALHKLLPLVDSAFFYDNTVKFIQIAHLKNNILIDYDYDLPVWFWELVAENDLKTEM
ncbi:MAG: zeta toxin family protein [Clostridia bacterium]|nr:zeta toxin family protein [Clostridia bacterium]